MELNIKISENEVNKDLLYKKQLEIEHKNFNVFFIGKGSYVGDLLLLSPWEITGKDYCHNFQVGRYCSLGNNIKVLLNMNHDYKSVYQGIVEELADTDSLNQLSARGQMHHRTRKKGQAIIQNDCWIGNNVIIMAGVTIHSGAVIGAGAVITKDVPPYAIVAGNPAKVVGYRFEETIRDELLRIAWWNWESKKLIEQKELLQGDVAEFIVANSSGKADYGRTCSGEERSGSASKYLFFIDSEDDYPLHERIMKEFIEKFDYHDAELMIAYNINSMEETKQIERLHEEWKEYNVISCSINFYGIDMSEQYKLFQMAHCYITNRSSHNIERTCLADLYKMKTISGVDLPVF
ncbi:MAG: CatB-related O-acetyltransferase [Lachnospiraceae bacterium]|nr:CatB-related O-acetyltransferase [Lachnospiraceae bacterium]